MSGDARGGGATAGALHVVSTPIGNLADLTPRAAAVLREVALIVAEDTRVARTLLEGLGIDRPVESLPAFDERARIAPILARLNGGESVALISDAGTPLISDPGQHLVAAAIASGVRVVPIPGASALLAAVVASGIVGARWVFEGFLPRSGGERERAIGAIAADDRASVIYEAGNRVEETLRDLAAACGDERPAAICRELTKLHEEVQRGSLAALGRKVAAGEIDGRGEFVLVVGAEPPRARDDVSEGAYPAALAAVEAAIAAGESRSGAVRRIATEWHLERRRLWALAHEPGERTE